MQHIQYLLGSYFLCLVWDMCLCAKYLAFGTYPTSIVGALISDFNTLLVVSTHRGKERGMEKESERQEEKVKKVCKRCHQNYTPSSNTPSSCRFHPSFFVCRRHDDQKRYTTLPRTLYLSIHLYESFMMFLHTHFLNFTAFLDTWIAFLLLFNTHVLNWIICRIYMYI